MDEIKKEFVNMMVKAHEAEKNRLFGKFIIQANDVEFYLRLLNLVRSAFPDKNYETFLFERAEMGALINLFNASAKRGAAEFHLYRLLQKYNKERNKLAHKMNSDKRLTDKQCEAVLKDGEKIVKALKHLCKERLGDFENKESKPK